MFYAPGFDPYLITFQIMCVQSLMYLDIGLWICLLTGLSGSPMHLISLRQIFSHDAVRLSVATGWVTFIAFILNASVGYVARANMVCDFIFARSLTSHAFAPHAHRARAVLRTGL